MEFQLLIVPVCLMLIAIITSTTAADQMSCYTCNSTLDHNCQEKFNHDQSLNPLRSASCTVWNTRFCVKVTGIYGGIVGTHRFCSSRDLGNQCQDIHYPDHDRMYRACVYTCGGNNCNSASSISNTRTITIFSLFLSTMFFFK